MITLSPQQAPLTADKHGSFVVTGTRVPLEVVVGDFNRGASPEEIVLAYPSLSLADVYAVIAYYLREQESIDTYVARQDERAEAARARHSVDETSRTLRAKLLARRS